MKRKTKLQKVLEIIDNLEIGEQIDKEVIVASIWSKAGFFEKRIFDVYLCKAKKLLEPKVFETRLNKEVKRIV